MWRKLLNSKKNPITLLAQNLLKPLTAPYD